MTTIGIRELARRASAVVSGVARTKRPAIITRRGQPVAAVVPIDLDALEDFVLANAPPFVRAMEQADEALRRGETRPAEDVFRELGATE
jgi:prevent-host-death family protein